MGTHPIFESDFDCLTEMTVVIENKEALKSWLTKTLSPICDADPVSLSKYVVALITKKDRNEKELKSICNEQLEVFLQKDTKDFIDKLFRCIKYKDYVKRSRSRDRRSRSRSPRRRSPVDTRRAQSIEKKKEAC